MERPVINIDWLAFSIQLIPSPLEKDSHRFELIDPALLGFRLVELGGNNIYRRRAIIYAADGSKVLTLLFDPYSRVIAYDSCLVEVANSYLYDCPVNVGGVCYQGLDWVMELLQHLHPFCFQCLSRLDVCCDFELTPARADFVRRLAANEIYVQRYAEGCMFHDFEMLRGARVARVPKQLSWGSKHSNIKWKLYNKSLELFDYQTVGDQQVRQCSKPYIVRQWLAAGYDDSNVWRLEVSITPMAKYLYHGQPVTFGNLCNWFWLTDFYTSMYMSKFVCRRNEGHADRSNDTRVWLLGNHGFTDRLQVRPSRNVREVQEYVSCLRAAMLQRSKVEVQVSTAMLSLWTATAVECVRLGHLEGYFQRTYGYAIDDIESHVDIDLQRLST